MKYFLLIYLIFLVSCSVIQKPADSESRSPSSEDYKSSCALLVGPFLKETNRPDLINKSRLIEMGIIRKEDLKILEGKLIIDSLTISETDIKQTAVSYLLIKKKFPHFEEEQILTHYQLLKETCGL